MWCKPFSVLATVCNEMGSMSGCNGYNGMCQTPGSVIQACTAQGPIPNSLSTDDATSAVIAMCSTHSMVGCQNCTSPSQCPHPMNTLSQVCLEMPGMSGCDAFYNFCHATDNTFKQLCGEGPPQGLPPMKMWLHASIRDILLIKSWVPENGGAYAASCIAVIAAAVLVQALKAWRVMLEVRWVQRRQAECCSPSCNAKAVDGAMAGHSMSAPLGSDSDLEAPVSGLSQRASTKRLPQFVPHKDQWSRNAVRAVFTGIIVFFDYMLMLIVMSFNIGIILSAVAGFALGALLFGHMGERAGGATVVAVGDVAPDSENDLEVHFVEPQSCCNTRNV